MAGTILAFHYDMKRAMWSAEYMKRYAKTLADWGYNWIVYEVEDKYRYPKHPGIEHPDALSPEETRRRMDAFRAQGLKVMPLVQTLGHAEHVLTKAGYEHLRESPAHSNQYDPLSTEARDFICGLLDELIDTIQPEGYFHLGGDETWSLGQSEKCKPVVAEIGTGGLYLRHMLPILNHIIGRGLRPILWADIALSHPDIVERFPREVVWMDWDYWTGGDRWNFVHIWGKGRFVWADYQKQDLPQFRKHLERYVVDDRTRRDGTFRGFYCTDALRDMGFDVLVAPATRCYGDTMGAPSSSVHLPNCFAGARKGRDAGLGSCVTSWTVRHSHPEANLPGAFAAAQGFSGKGTFEMKALAKDYTKRHFGAATPGFAEAMLQASVGVPWSEAREMPAPAKAKEALTAWLAKVDKQPDGRTTLCASIEKAAAGFQAAEACFTAMQKKAKTNAHSLDYWLEGVGYVSFCAAFDLAVLQNRLAAESASLLERLAAQKERTRALFAETFPPTSVNEELSVRYAFHEAIIKSATP
jgi:hypothetical protein